MLRCLLLKLAKGNFLKFGWEKEREWAREIHNFLGICKKLRFTGRGKNLVFLKLFNLTI